MYHDRSTFARATTTKKIYLDEFTPREWQIPIFDAIENKGFKKVIAIWPRRCLSGASHIIMEDGSFKLLRDIVIGDKILSWNGSSFVPDTVKNVWKTELKETSTVSSAISPDLVASTDHVFANRCFNTKIRWLPLIKINKHRRQLVHYAGSVSSVHNPELASFWGFMLADGYVSGYQQPKFTNINMDILKKVEELTYSLFGYKAIWRKKGKGFDLGMSNGTLGGGTFTNKVKELFRGEGIDVPKSQQRLPKSIWSYDEDSLLHFFSALISSDGSIYCAKKGFTAADTKHNVPLAAEITLSCGSSYNYAWDIYWLLRKIGIIPQKPYLERSSNWKIKIGKHWGIKKLLAFPVIGKIEAQEKILCAIKDRYWKQQIKRGCFYGTFKSNESKSEILYDIETETHHNFIANGYLVHNSGKDMTAFNLVIRQALRKPCVIYYIFPTYAQGKKVLWDSITNDGKRILSYIPDEIIASKNSQEMKINLINGSLIQIVGSNDFDRLVGTNPQGCVFSEYALQDPRAYQFIRPILTANNGWALFVSTPRGKNNLWKLYQIALHSDDWFVSKLTLDDTKHIPLERIEKERAEGIMSEDLIQQEYWTSFELGVEGAFYSKYIDDMRLKNQIGNVPWDPSLKVNTAWDIGVRDSTSIIFFQTVGNTVRIIDFYENNKHGIEHYAKMINDKPYIYNKHIAPHDIKVREWGSGLTRIERAASLGISFSMSVNTSIYDGIEAVRSTLPRTWIDENNCAKLIKSLENYRQIYDDKKATYVGTPLHNWATHAADSMRYLCVTLKKISGSGMTAEELQQNYHEVRYGSSLPYPFN